MSALPVQVLIHAAESWCAVLPAFSHFRQLNAPQWISDDVSMRGRLVPQSSMTSAAYKMLIPGYAIHILDMSGRPVALSKSTPHDEFLSAPMLLIILL